MNYTSFACIVGLLACPVAAPAKDILDPATRQSLACQIALESLGLSPGVLDGKIGPKTTTAVLEFQRVRNLPATGQLDPATLAALGPPAAANPIATYIVRPNDLSNLTPVPRGWVEKSKMKYLGHASVLESLAEKFHCSQALLERLNPGRNLKNLQARDALNVPAVNASALPPCARLEVDLSGKTIRAIARDGRLVALFHCSIAAKAEKRPIGEARVVSVAENPTYRFDPAMWPEVKNVDRKLLIPPGPRNPVGLCWIGLNLPGYGIHGTPNPELIGKTGSHGCFRLTNWDALRLGKMVAAGTAVTFLSDDKSRRL